MDALSAVVAAEEGPRGLRSNVIAPGPIMDTEGFERLSTGSEDEFDATAKTRVPLQRYGRIEDIASACVWLFSDAAGWVTGQVLVSS